MIRLFVQRDAPLDIRRELRGVLVDCEVVETVPDGVVPTRGRYVTVTSDGTPVSQRMWSRENVRINVYASSGPEARKIASVIDAYLLNPSNCDGYKIHPGAGLLVVRDESHGGYMASVTVRADTNKEAYSGW